jgi:hypothetical protein
MVLIEMKNNYTKEVEFNEEESKILQVIHTLYPQTSNIGEWLSEAHLLGLITDKEWETLYFKWLRG